MLILLLLIVTPLAEIATFIQVGGWIGLWPTLGLVVVTAILGTVLLRQQGFSTWHRANQSMRSGGVPIKELFDGLCLLVAGAVLLTPGFITDAIGFLLLTPPVRDALRLYVAQRLRARGATFVYQGMGGAGGPYQGPTGAGSPSDRRESAHDDGTVIDASYREVDESRPPGSEPGGSEPGRARGDRDDD